MDREQRGNRRESAANRGGADVEDASSLQYVQIDGLVRYNLHVCI